MDGEGVVNVSYHNTDADNFANDIKKDENKMELNLQDQTKDVKTERRQFYISFGLGWVSLSLSASVFLTLLNSITSLLAEDNLGMTSLAIGSAVQFVTTSLFLAFITKLIGVKRTIIFAISLILLFNAAFFHPSLPLFIPASALMGIGLSIIFCNSYVFNNSLGLWYHQFAGGNLDAILFFISGLTSAALGSGFLWGNVIYYWILDTETSSNDTQTRDVVLCGANYCNEDLGNSTIAVPLPIWKVRTLMGVFLGMVSLALLLFLFVTDPMTKLKANPGKLRDFFIILKNTYSLLKDSKGLLLIIITIFIGMEEQFIIAVFTYAYVTCSLGVSKVGYIMFSFGLSQIITPFIQWPLMKYFGRPVVIGLFYFVFLGEMLGMLFFKPTGNDSLVYYVFAVVYGAADTMIIATVFYS